MHFMRWASVLCLLMAFFAQKQAWAAVPPPGTIIVNHVDSVYRDGTGTAMPVESATADLTTTGQVRTQGIVEFADASGDRAFEYMVGNPIYIKVTDPDQDKNPAITETVTVVVAHYHKNTDSSFSQNDHVTVTLTETGPGTGVFFSSVPTDAGPPDMSDGVLSVETDSKITVTYTDPLDAAPTDSDSALIDPFGIVFDSITGAPVSVATVTLIDNATGLPAVLPQPPTVPFPQLNTVITGADGAFRFQFVNPGRYHIVVTPGGSYTFPSMLPTSGLPPGYIIVRGSRGETFTLTVGMAPLNLDIPIDGPRGMLSITKTADVDTAQLGDIIQYALKAANDGDGPVTAASVVDVMPHGVIYIKGSAYINSAPGADPVNTGDRGIAWPVGTIAPGSSVEIVFKAAIGPDSTRGDGINVAYVQGTSVGIAVASPKAVFRIKISEGVFTTKGTIIGKVFADNNGDGAQGPDEHGVPGVALYMEDGTRIVTDEDGKYSIPAVTPLTHVVKVDDATLPKGAALLPITSRNMGDGGSQFVDMQEGGLSSADFAVSGVTAAAKSAARDAHPADKTDADTDNKSHSQEFPLEDAIKEMTPVLEFLEPRDGAVMPGRRINVLLKAPSDAGVFLYVNGVEAGKGRIGKKAVYEAHKVAIYQYVGIEITQGERDMLRAVIKDPFGNERGSKEITLHSPGMPFRIELTPEKSEVVADGSTVTELVAKALDKDGNVVVNVGEMTVTTTAGELLGMDMDPNLSGVQIAPDMSVARIRLRAPTAPSTARLAVSLGGVSGTATVVFTPDLRKIIAVGVGEVRAGYGTKKGDAGLFTKDNWFDDGFYARGRGAFFIKGDIGMGMLLTASYDSEKKKQDVGLFREKTQDVESDERYQIYGDSSQLAYEAPSSDKLYVRVDKGHSYMMYGDYPTDLSETRLGAFRRNLTGVKSEINTDKFSIKGFASSTYNVQAVDKFQGRGTAGYYFLSRSPVLDGSELVVVETRDRLQPETVISRRVMARWSDYHIDYPTGAILFKGPVESHDSAFNPVYIIVSFEAGGENTHMVYGGRASAAVLGRRLEAGITGLVEENGVSDFRLLGADMTLRLPLNTTLKAEYTRTDAPFNIGSVFVPKQADAWYVRLEGAPVSGLKFSSSYYRFADFFFNPSATDVTRGKRGYNFDAQYAITDKINAQVKYLDEKDTLNKMEHLYASAGVAAEIRGVKMGLDMLYSKSNDRFVPIGSPNTRFPFDISYETPDRLTALKLRVETPLWKDVTANAEHTQDLLHNKDNLTQAGIDYRFSSTKRLYVREQYATYDKGSQLRTVVGTESAIDDNTVTFSEYRLTGVANGESLQHSMGLKSKLDLAYGITGNLAVERLKTLTGLQNKNEPDAFAASLGLEYLQLTDLKVTARFEFRDSKSDVSRLGEAGLAYKLNGNLSLMATGRYFDDRGDTGTRSTARAALGLAYRPAWSDRFNALARVEYKREQLPNATAARSSDSYIASIEGIYKPFRDLQVTGKYAARLTMCGATSSYTDLISARVLYGITDRLDIGVTFRTLANRTYGSHVYGGSAEVGYRVFKNVWLSVGYSLDSFDSDLTQDDYSCRGPYVRLRVKLDEKTFK